MLRQTKDLNGYKLGARDGEIGMVQEFYFDDQTWTVRYLVADTGSWLSGRQILISPYALSPATIGKEVIPVDLTKKQIEDSPSLETHKPVSRQYELQYYPYYGWPAYWEGAEMLGSAPMPLSAGGGLPNVPVQAENNDPHLRSTKDVTGHTIQARDGEIGHVEDFVVDDETWAIRYLIVGTKNWWPGRKVLISTRWVDRISWEDSKVFVDLTRETIQLSPEYTEQSLISREYETALHDYYKRGVYWEKARATDATGGE